MKIHSFESLAALDGKGIRYALFLGGCPLRCVYCHNPDTWTVEGCEDKSPEELFNKIKRYKPYFKAGGGGVTFSGGEPLMQAGELVLLADLLDKENIGYTVDTACSIPLTDDIKELLKRAELVIVDLKFADCESYKKFTRGDLPTVLSYLDYLKSISKTIWLRTVIVPGLNDNEAFIDSLAELSAPYNEIIEKYELLAFHTMGFFKYDSLGLVNPLENTPPLSVERKNTLQQYLDTKRSMLNNVFKA